MSPSAGSQSPKVAVPAVLGLPLSEAVDAGARPLRVEYDPQVDALAIDFPGTASMRTVRLDRDRALDYDAAGRLVSIELLNVSKGVELDGLPERGLVQAALALFT